MLIGIPKEIKDHEFRVGATPAGVKVLTDAGHEIHVESGAGAAIGFDDAAYRAAGATIVPGAGDVYQCPLIVKVKEPQPEEIPRMWEGQVIFGYFHLSPEPELTKKLVEQKVIAIAYETVTDSQGGTPLLAPMSEVAGRLSIQAGANALQMINGGNGTLLGGVPGVMPGKVVIIGAGTVGTEAAKMAMGLGADVTILDINLHRLRTLDNLYLGRLKTRYSEAHAIATLCSDADLVVGSILIPGKLAPKLISRNLVKTMRPGSVLVDVAIDQGGCSETSRPTTHSQPLYVEEDIVHYCVTNMPAAVARTSTQALTNATLPYVLELAGKGYKAALLENPGLRKGLQIHRGSVTYKNVAEDLGYAYLAAEQALVS